MTRSLLILLITTVLASCASPQSSSGTEPGKSPHSPTAAPEISYRDPLFAPLNGIDLTQFKRVGEGLRLIGSKGEYELLLTEPGHPVKVSKHDFSGIDWNRTDKFLEYSGYMLRWKKNTDEAVPYIGRLTFPTDDGRKKVYTGAFDARYYRKKLFSGTNRNPKVFLEGWVTAYNKAGKVIEQVYRVNRYAVTYIGPERDIRFYTMADATHRQLLIAPSESGGKPLYTTASALPEYEFVLPRPERLMAQSGWGDDRELFTREFSLAALLRAHKINPDQLLMPALRPRKEKLGGRGQSTFIGHRAWVDKGQAAFLHSATTGKTYLQPYQQQAALTLPSVKEIVINGQLSVNRQCMGKSDGMVVLSGQCDPAAPAFPLTVMTQISATQYSINVWSDIDRRSSYLLTGGQFPKEDFYRWSIDAFMVEELVDPEATIATLATGDDPFSQTLIAFASRGADQQVCDKLAAAADSAAKALKLNPDIEGHLADYKKYGLDMDWRSMGIAIDRIKPNNTPVTDFNKYVWNDLVAMEKDLKQRLSLLQRYQGVSNSACQPDSDRMTGLVTALSHFQQSLTDAMDKLDETYYAEAVALEKEIYYWSGRLEQAKRDAAVAQFFSKLESSLNAERSAKQQERASIRRSQQEARQLISAQINDVKSRNAAFLKNTSPVVAAPGGSKIAPVAMPAKPMDSAADSKIYISATQSGRLSTREAIAQAQAKTKRLAEENQLKASNVSESTTVTEPTYGPGGAAICVAVGRNSANNRTDIDYFYAYDLQRTPLNVERQARQKHGAAYRGTPSCRHNRDGQLGALVVVVWQGQDYTGAPSRTYGMGFGPSLGAAEKDAVENLATRNWAWTSAKGYELEFAKQY
ncbi:hypothetical protein [Spongiibacter tropicus]|uniref:hypothetical protein n=1 Tax=Spongiibacter tropicus TaxID=454602 RepID=UPI0003B44818|nr:hypothetical protein [Spongiibacter tropicus]